MDKMEGAKPQAQLLKAGNNLVLSSTSFTDVNTIGCKVYLVGKTVACRSITKSNKRLQSLIDYSLG